MIQVNPVNRIHSFEEMQNSIAEQTFEQINFTDEEKEIYQKTSGLMSYGRYWKATDTK